MTPRLAAGGLAIFVVFDGGAFMASAQQAAPVPAARRQFVACPIVRDTRTQPCWLAEYEGELYYLGQQGGVANDFYPPQLGHEALVEGVVGQGRVCGGIPLQPVKVSVLRELTPACRTMLPAEDNVEAPPPVPSPRGSAPSWVKVEGPGDVTLYFDFDSDFLSLHVTNALTAIAGQVGPDEDLGRRGDRVHRGDASLKRETAGRTQHDGRDRARKVADILIGLGVFAGRITVKPARSLPADGVNDPWNRRVDVRVR